MRFSDPEIRDVSADPGRFVARRLASDDNGFNYVPRRWLETAIATYHETDRSVDAAIAAFQAVQPGRKGMTDWKRQHAATTLRQFERFVTEDGRDPTDAVPLFASRPRLTPFGRHELSMRLDLWLPDRGVLRQIWTDQKSRLSRRGTTMRAAALAVTARRHVDRSLIGVEIWQLRYRQRLLIPVADLDRRLARLKKTLDWVEDQLQRRRTA